MNKDFGYTAPHDIEWAERTSRTSISGLPYGTSPSQQAMWDKYNSDRDKKDLENFIWCIVAMVLVFICAMPFLGR